LGLERTGEKSFRRRDCLETGCEVLLIVLLSQYAFTTDFTTIGTFTRLGVRLKTGGFSYTRKIDLSMQLKGASYEHFKLLRLDVNLDVAILELSPFGDD